jgi:RNA polymerase sigma factor for flagellar operon FliA
MPQHKISAEEIEQFWKEFNSQRTAFSREQLVLSYLNLVKYVAGRIAIGLPTFVEVDDLFGAGLLGLMQAIDKYEPERNTKFETYAIPRIRGAMLDELRSQDWFPRSIRRKAKLLENAYAELESRLERSAADDEIAGYLKISMKEYYELVDEVCLTTLISLDKEITNCNGGIYAVLGETARNVNALDPEQILERKELEQIIRETLANLPEKERVVLTLYYFEELTLKEIGEVLGISESRVCQIHTKAIMRLRGRVIQFTKTVSLKHLSDRMKKSNHKKTPLPQIA